MSGSLVTLPVRVGIRCAGLALRGTYAVTERALGLAGAVAGSIIRPDSPDVDLDGARHDAADRDRRPGSSSQARSASPPAAPPAPEEPETATAREPAAGPPAPLDEQAHVSEEPELVRQVADPGAEDGAGAEVHVAEPWDGYRQMKADDVIDRITGASVAELAAVELYELSSRSRQTVIDAVKRELNRSGTDH